MAPRGEARLKGLEKRSTASEPRTKRAPDRSYRLNHRGGEEGGKGVEGEPTSLYAGVTEAKGMGGHRDLRP